MSRRNKCEKCGRSIIITSFKVYGKVLCHACALEIPYDIRISGDTPFADAMTSDCQLFSIKNPDIIRALELCMLHTPAECIAEVKPEDLLGMGTTCGHAGNHAFQQDVIDIFRKYNIDKTIAGLVYDEDNDEYEVFAFFIPISPETHHRSFLKRIAGEIERAIEKHEGSAYADYNADGWLFFVSE